MVRPAVVGGEKPVASAIGDTEEVTRRVYLDPSEVVRRRIARETG